VWEVDTADRSLDPAAAVAHELTVDAGAGPRFLSFAADGLAARIRLQDDPELAAAFEALSPGLQKTLEGLNAVHSASREYSSQGHSAQKRGSMKVAEADGYVGVRTSVDGPTQAAISATNAGRRQAYARSAADAGTSAEVAGARMFETQLLPRISSNVLVTGIEPEANPLKLWLESLTRLEHLAPGSLVLPSHERVFRGLHARTQELREHHEHQFALLRAYLTEHTSCTAFEAMQCLFPRLRGPVDDMLALGESIAHLSWLRYEGVLRRVLDEDGAHRFALADPTFALTLPPHDSNESPELAEANHARH
jgi:uncharacterized protein YdbL (DUF1318 family)